MSSVGGAIASQVGSNHLSAIRNIPVVDGTVEESKSTLRLVVGNFMSGFVDTKETEVAVLADLSILSTIHGEGLVACGGELLAVRVVHGERNGLSTKPVADVVGVTV